MGEKTLWEQFSVPEENHPPGSGLMYFLRYSEERIHGHRQTVVSALKDKGVQLDDLGEDGIGVRVTSPLENYQPVTHLLEELSVLNQATEYYEHFGEQKTLSELKEHYVSKYIEAEMRTLKPDLVGAYHTASVEIPSFVRELRWADSNDVLSRTERNILYELELFGIEKSKKMNNPGGKVLFRVQNM